MMIQSDAVDGGGVVTRRDSTARERPSRTRPRGGRLLREIYTWCDDCCGWKLHYGTGGSRIGTSVKGYYALVRYWRGLWIDVTRFWLTGQRERACDSVFLSRHFESVSSVSHRARVNKNVSHGTTKKVLLPARRSIRFFTRTRLQPPVVSC